MFTHSYRKHDFNFDPILIPNSIRQLAKTKPDSEAFVFLSNDGPREAITWMQFHATCVDYAKSLMTLGVQPGDIVAITAINSSENLYAIFGSLLAGAVPFGMSLTYNNGDNVVSIFKKLEKCCACVVDPNQTWDVMKSLLTSYNKSGHVTSEKLPSLRYLILTSPPKNETDVFTTADLLKIRTEVLHLPVIDPDDIAAMFQTSGTTGIPKTFAHTHRSISWTAQRFSTICFGQAERFYNDGSFRWAGGWPYNVLTGETMICIRRSFTERSMGLVVSGIKQERCSALRSTASLLHHTFDKQTTVGDDWPIRTLIISGLPVSKHTVSFLKPLCSRLVILYGTGEVPLVLANILKKDDDFEDYCCGGPTFGREVKVVDDEGQTVPVNTRGELYMKGPAMFEGYFNDPDLTKKAVTEDGWYKSDDIGYMATDGRVFVQGRKSEAMVCGGAIVYPTTVESLLKSCPGVSDVAVVPVPDDAFFQLMCACVIREPGSEITEDTIRNFMKEVYSTEEGKVMAVLIKHFMFVESFPLSDTGKVLRKGLVDEAVKTIPKL